LSRNPPFTAKIQGQGVKAQGHSVTQRRKNQ